MKKIISILLLSLIVMQLHAQDTISFRNQYKGAAKDFSVTLNGARLIPDKSGKIIMTLNSADSFLLSGKNYDDQYLSLKNADSDKVISLHKKFSWTDLLLPMFYIVYGGLWFILFVVFAETGLFAGFFFPGDSLLFVTGILAGTIVEGGLGIHGAGAVVNLLLLGILISVAGILGNYTGYWFGRKSGPFLFERKDSFLFRKKYLFQAKDFYDRHGGGAIIAARFLPIIRTFAPIVAGIVGMEKKKFSFYNVAGSIAWVFTMLIAGHYLEQLFLHYFHFDLKEHLEAIVIGIVLVTTAPVLMKLFFGKKKPRPTTPLKNE